MYTFKQHTLLLDISAADAAKRLNALTKRRFLQRSRFHLFKGWIGDGRFKLKPTFAPSVIKIEGLFKGLTQNRSSVSISCRLVWHHLITNTIVFVISLLTLVLFSGLLYAEDKLYGLFGFMGSILLLWFLFYQLIGRVKKNYTNCITIIKETLAA